jgi:tetratricopeptide (TPR) repeat protein
MPVPISKALEFANELEPILNNPKQGISESTLRDFLAHARALLKETRDPVARGALHSIMCMAYTRLDQHEDALSESRHALLQDRGNPYHLHNLATCLTLLKRYEEAIDYLREARALHPPRELALGTWFNEAEAWFRLGRTHEANTAFEVAASLAHPSSTNDLFWLAVTAARCGRDEDAAEFLARYLTVAQSTALDDTPAVDVIRAAPDELLASVRGNAILNEAIGRVLARDEAAVPDDMQVNSGIVLGPEAWATVESLLESPPAPSDALRRLVHER